LNATPTTDFASRNVAFTELRAWREEPEKSTSARSPRFVMRACTRYSSSSATPSASMTASPSHVPSGSAASASLMRSAPASHT
jgi:hypothetical protein